MWIFSLEKKSGKMGLAKEEHLQEIVEIDVSMVSGSMACNGMNRAEY